MRARCATNVLLIKATSGHTSACTKDSGTKAQLLVQQTELATVARHVQLQEKMGFALNTHVVRGTPVAITVVNPAAAH